VPAQGKQGGTIVRRTSVGLVAAMVAASALATAGTALAAPTRTLALYNLDEPPGATVLVDDSGNGYDGTVGTSITRDGAEHIFPWHDGAAGGSVDLQHLDLVANKALNPGTRDYAVTIRLKFTLAIGNVMNLGQSGGAGGMVKFQLDDKGGRIACQFVGSLGSATVSSSTVINDGAWHVVTCTRTSTQVQMTLDGAIVSTSKHATGNIAPNLPLSIGGKSQCAPPTVDCDYYTGQIDYVEIQSS
jgi:Concanavalin A-like lectin/glucanases superfamily